MKKITVITGHYGSGKTNLTVNLAVNAAKEGHSVTVVDLDIVNPYFRTADFQTLFKVLNMCWKHPSADASSVMSLSRQTRRMRSCT